MLSILEKDYIPQLRPYSQDELKNMQTTLYKTLRIGDVFANHESCGHFYRVKNNGRKEKEIKESSSVNCGNCSVCWKFKNTPKNIQNIASDMIKSYCNDFGKDNFYLTYDLIDLESVFYQWLYKF